LKILNGILALIFVLFAYWQLNDPDALTWVIIYLLVAGVSAYAIFKKIERKYLLFLLSFFLIYTLSYSPYILDWILKGMPSITEEMQAATPYIEYTREFFGLLISLLVIVYHYYFSCSVRNYV
jgi:hypothetical protein